MVSDPRQALGAEPFTPRELGVPRQGPDGHRSIDLERKLFDPDLNVVCFGGRGSALFLPLSVFDPALSLQ